MKSIASWISASSTPQNSTNLLIDNYTNLVLGGGKWGWAGPAGGGKEGKARFLDPTS